MNIVVGKRVARKGCYLSVQGPSDSVPYERLNMDRTIELGEQTIGNRIRAMALCISSPSLTNRYDYLASLA